jgi:hypothetical protein
LHFWSIAIEVSSNNYDVSFKSITAMLNNSFDFWKSFIIFFIYPWGEVTIDDVYQRIIFPKGRI